MRWRWKKQEGDSLAAFVTFVRTRYLHLVLTTTVPFREVTVHHRLFDGVMHAVNTPVLCSCEMPDKSISEVFTLSLLSRRLIVSAMESARDVIFCNANVLKCYLPAAICVHSL